METLERTGADEGTPEQPAANGGGSAPDRSRTNQQYVRIAVGFALALGLIYWAFVEEKIRSTLLTVIIAVGASAGIWIGANLLFNQVRGRWQLFNTIAFGVVGAILGIALHGNLVTIGSGTGFLTWVVGPAAGAAAFGGLGYVLAGTDDPRRRRVLRRSAGA